ncbi:MAG: hypothetical protein M3Y68_06280, partial [Chloroflexota bacterium]|nr:hypothetical protein [Chloroflexota bacterium]
GGGGVQVNFHVDKHVALERALEAARRHGGVVLDPIVDMGDGVRYVNLRDSEGNPIALSSYEAMEGENE